MIRIVLFSIVTGLIAMAWSSWRQSRHLDTHSKDLSDPIINDFTRRMEQELGLERMRVFVYDTPAINGLASADGRIFITRGFMDKYKLGEVRAEEIAGVIAHELGHVALGHAKRRMLDFTGANTVRVVLTVVIGRFIPFIGPWIADMAGKLLAARLSRQDEYEADAYAAALMTKVGLGVGPQISLFQKLERLGGGGGGQLAWLMSHPATEDRIHALNMLADSWRKS